MPADLAHTGQVGIVGGGVIGCSIADHLTTLGIADTILLERRQLRRGTAWHAWSVNCAARTA